MGTHEPWGPVLMSAGARPDIHDLPGQQPREGTKQRPQGITCPGAIPCHHLFPLFADAEQSGSPRAGMGSDQEDSKPITLGESGEREGRRARPLLCLSLGSHSLSTPLMCSGGCVRAPHTHEWLIPHSSAVGKLLCSILLIRKLRSERLRCHPGSIRARRYSPHKRGPLEGPTVPWGI